MAERPQAVLRVEPHQVPALRAAFVDAAAAIDERVTALDREGMLATPWLGDPVSATVLAVYNKRAAGQPDAAREHLVAYREELARVAQALGAIDADYRGTEQDNTALWGLA